jgi:hypothetical protein
MQEGAEPFPAGRMEKARLQAVVGTNAPRDDAKRKTVPTVTTLSQAPRRACLQSQSPQPRPLLAVTEESRH